ncbi:MAG: hypothetical protein WCZ86_01970 [Desulfurivibrionaceae bacterium]|jgi:hypothetical protein
MAGRKLRDREAKDILLGWPTRTKKLWPPPGGKGYWIQGQPKKARNMPGPCLSAPGAALFKTQPDGLWVHFQGQTSCDVVVVEVCGTIQNLNDKRSRYVPSSHSLVLSCKKEWLDEKVSVNKGGQFPRWKASASFGKAPHLDLSVPVRHLRVLYALPNDNYHEWCAEHVPTGYEFFCPHSSLDSYNSQRMQTFLRQMSIAAQFYTKPKPG